MDVQMVGSWRVQGYCHVASPHDAVTVSRYLLTTAGSWWIHGFIQNCRIMEGS